TQQKAVQKELLLAKKEAENAQKVEQEFLANMSHEIRTPLNAIIGISHLLYDTNPSAEQLEYFTIIKNSANFLHTLISDVLDMAKIDAGKIQPKNEPFDLLSLLDTVQRTFELKIRKKNLKIITITDDRISNLIKGDDTLLNQILLNLVGNAEKFTERGSVTIKTDVIEDKKDKLFIKFSIKDTGVGIPKEDLEIIFQKFRQVSSKQQSKTRGTGLGLAIVKELVKSMQGKEMEVRSNKEEGTEFSFVLPFTKTNIKRGSQLKILETESINFSRKRILLVEDNSLNTLYATKLLKRWDIEVTHAKDGLEAVEMIHKHYFDLILMDIQMPNLNGYEATIQIRNTININKVIPIIALTASASPDDQVKAIDVGMNDVLTKPFTPTEMQVVLVKYLNSADSQKINTKMNEKTEVYFNEERLNKIYGSDNDFKKMVFDTFLEEIPSQIAEIRNFVKNKNWTELAKVAHKMKPALGMVGLTSGEEDLRIIETTIKAEGINKQIVELITAFIENCDTYVNRIKEELKKIS
ncbi:MAG: CheY-like chemotaxis protein/HPt (histidine-containing phosphotransfer) domain-containing protein, partial [Algoriphagus sp.]